MIIPTGLAVTLTLALREGALQKVQDLAGGDLMVNDCHALLTTLLSGVSEPEVRDYYQAIIDKLEYKP